MAAHLRNHLASAPSQLVAVAATWAHWKRPAAPMPPLSMRWQSPPVAQCPIRSTLGKREEHAGNPTSARCRRGALRMMEPPRSPATLARMGECPTSSAWEPFRTAVARRHHPAKALLLPRADCTRSQEPFCQSLAHPLPSPLAAVSPIRSTLAPREAHDASPIWESCSQASRSAAQIQSRWSHRWVRAPSTRRRPTAPRRYFQAPRGRRGVLRRPARRPKRPDPRAPVFQGPSNLA
mmetsp:Transcript_148939/g.478576  ORF Transcript_148939/g.478576 Transcript_148939/m.478576 type:complete len:236 (-) Transcript_148939:125-832(-)